nr:hypothetical protein [Tanacetum cinerariifolium]
MNLLNEECLNYVYGDGKPLTCNKCGEMLRGGFCFPCNFEAENSYNSYQDAYSFDDISNNSNSFPQPQYENYVCNLCGNNSHDGYDCQQQFPFIYEQEPSYNQNCDDNYYPYESPSFPCCDNCGESHETFQCQPMAQNIDFSSSDQIQTPQYHDVHPPSQEISDEIIQANHYVQYKENLENSSNSNQEKEEPPQDSDIHQLIEECSTKVSEEQNITPETKSDEVTESNAENPLPIPSECEVTSDDEIECDMPAKDNSFPAFTTSSNPLFNNDDLDSSDDESLPDEDVPAEEFKVYSNPLFGDDEINSDKLDPHCFNVESDFVESLLNRDTFIDSSSKFDFSGELAHVNPEIPKSDIDFEEEIRLIENLLYDNSSPRLPEEFNAEIADTIVESILSLPIPVQDGNSQREEIDIVTETDDVLPPSVENDDDSSNDPILEEVDLFLFDSSIRPGIENVTNDSEGDVRFLEELLIDDSILSHESSDSYFEDNPSIPRPPPKPTDAETDAGEEIPVVMNDKNKFDEDYYFFMFDKVFSLLSAKSDDIIFDPGISD